MDSKVVGFICYSARPHLNSDGLVGRITDLVVLPEYQNKGIGRRLSQFIEGHAKSLGHEKIELTTRNHRVQAHGFYRRLGYSETSKKFTKDL